MISPAAAPMAASATSLSTFSSLHSLRPPRFSLLTQLPPPPPSYLSSSSFSPLSLPSHPTNKLTPLLATPSDSDGIDADTETDTDKETEDDNPVFFETLYSDYDDGDVPQFVPRQPPEGYVPPPAFDELPPEDEETIAAAYEELYGPAYSGVSVLGNDVRVMDSKMLEDPVWGPDEDAEEGGVKDGLEERVVQVRRVTKVVKGGKQLHFRAVVVVGDKKGIVGVGVGKAKEVIAAVRKSGINARRNLITVPMTKYMTFPHRADGVFGAAKVMLRPACPGTGVLAGGSVRIVLELAGVENALGKQLGSDNALNNARATIVAVRQMRQFSEVAAERGIPMEEMWK